MNRLYRRLTAVCAVFVLLFAVLVQTPAALAAEAATEQSISANTAIAWKLWISEEAFGDVAGNALHPLEKGAASYLNYELTDASTGALLGSSHKNYKASVQIFQPDGTQLSPNSEPSILNAPRGNWKLTLVTPGTYTAVLNVTGTISVTNATIKFYVDPMEPIIVSETASSGAGNFIWGKDNWAFNNADSVFLNSSLPVKGYEVSSSMMNKLLDYADLPNIDREVMRHLPASYRNNTWNGSCFGMTALALLTKQGLFRPSNDAGLSDILHDNKSSSGNVISAINFFFQLQNIPSVVQVLDYDYDTRSTHTQKEYTDQLCKLNNSDPVNMCYTIVYKDKNGYVTGSSGHSVIAYAAADGEYYVNGQQYDVRILIADPAFTAANHATYQSCMYVRKQTGEWIIPYQNIKAADGSRACCYWNKQDGTAAGNGRIKDLLRHSSASAVTDAVSRKTNPDVYYSRPRVFDCTAKDIRMYQTDNPDQDLPVQKETISGTASGVSGLYHETFYCTRDSSRPSYLLARPGYTDFCFMMDYPDNAYFAELKSTHTLTTAPQGYIELNGKNADYSVMMTSNEGYCPTDWYSVSVSGSGVNSMIFRKTDEGYLVTADNLDGVHVMARNSGDQVTADFSTEYKSALIYEVNETTIGVKVDADGNGTYETVITGGAALYGDVNGDSTVNLKDATEILRYFNITEGLGEESDWSEEKIRTADVDLSGHVDPKDATCIQKYYHFKEIMEEPKTWYEIVGKEGVPKTL